MLNLLRRKEKTDWSKNRVKSRESCEITLLIHEQVNYEREKRGIPRISYDHHLAYIARGHSKDMAHYNYCGHVNRRGESPTDRAIRKGFDCNGGKYIGIGENCFQLWSFGQLRSGKRYTKKLRQIATEAVRGWMASSGHARNILNPHYRMEGVGFARSKKHKSKVYLTQNFF